MYLLRKLVTHLKGGPLDVFEMGTDDVISFRYLIYVQLSRFAEPSHTALVTSKLSLDQVEEDPLPVHLYPRTRGIVSDAHTSKIPLD